MFFLIINGPSCSGKSTIIKEIMKTEKNLFHLSYDALKWSFSQYSSKAHYQEVAELITHTAKFAFKKEHNVISDSSLYKKDRDKLITLAKEHKYRVIEINLEAELSILEKRFAERASSALATPGSRISNTSKERYKELTDVFEQEKNSEAIEIRTDNQTITKVVRAILELI